MSFRWQGAAIYQVYPRSFQDSNGDGVGDLPGITRRLVHIASLGVDAVWISPFFKSPMADMGYDVADFCAVDPLFGTMADFDALLAEAHRLGLKIIIDQVTSHVSDQHPWFVESRASRDNPRADWFVWVDPKPDGTAPNNWLSVFGGPAWEWDGVRRQYYMHSFLSSQPQLNYHQPQVQQAMLEVMRFWLERGVDGFRLDAVNHAFHDALLRSNPPVKKAGTADVPETNPYSFQDHLFDKSRPETPLFLERVRALLDRFPGAVSIGEVGDGDRSPETVRLYTLGEQRLHFCYTFDLFGPELSPQHIRRVFAAFGDAAVGGRVCWAFSNHDVMRHVSRWERPGDEAEVLAGLAIALLTALPGSICLYQGEELGLPEAALAFEDLRDPYGIRFWPAFKGRDGARTPMPWEQGADHGGFTESTPWLPVPEAHRLAAVDVQEGDPDSPLNCYREALAFRRGELALREGGMDFVETDGELLGFWRGSGDQAMLCLFNLGREEVIFPLAAGGALLRGSAGVVLAGEEVRLPGLGYGFVGGSRASLVLIASERPL